MVEFLAHEYQMDKVGTRKALFGHEAPMQKEPDDDLIARVGPWGPVRR